jgi:MoaA/NifB/PqqE/SkfB family radical SAM enzyme
MRFAGAWLPARPLRLRLLVLAVSDRCDQRCAHCSIWMGGSARPALTADEQLTVVEQAIQAGVEEMLLTGGEPLLAPHLCRIAERLKQAGVRVLLATNGLRLRTHAAWIGALVDEVYVSLDGGTAPTADALRGVGTLQHVARGVASLRELQRRPLLVARSTLSARNLHEFAAIVETARGLGFDHVSFLPLDAASSAFGARPQQRAPLVPSVTQIGSLLAEIERLDRQGAFADGYVLESAEKLRRLAGHLRASAGEQAFVRPECDAPWWSSVVDADGSLRPCFFHDPVGDVRAGLVATRGGGEYAASLRAIRGRNPVCDRCVCPKQRGLPLAERLLA